MSHSNHADAEADSSSSSTGSRARPPHLGPLLQQRELPLLVAARGCVQRCLLLYLLHHVNQHAHCKTREMQGNVREGMCHAYG
jgi:hypothetical protein